LIVLSQETSYDCEANVGPLVEGSPL